MTDQRPWANPQADPISKRAYALIFNGLTGALTEFMPLSQRARVSEAIFASLRDGGIEFGVVDGLAKLRAANAEVEFLASVADGIYLHSCGCPRGVGEDIWGHNPATCTLWKRSESDHA
jgi:hypothetical protein